MKKNSTYFIVAACLGLLVSACATKSDAYKDIDHAVYRNEFAHSIEAIQKGQEGKRPLYPEKNAISLFMDKGLLEHYAGNHAYSSQDLQEAERLIGEAFTKSITAGMASYIANDNTKEYPGEDFEDIYINIFNALNYYNAGKIDGALVEIRKITWSNGKLDMLERKYEDSRTSAGGYMLDQLRKLGISANPELPKGNAVNFSNSALARYLGALFYLGDGNTDSARIEFEQTRMAFAANPKIYYNSFPQAVEEARTVPPGKARLNVIGFSGLSPVKEEGVYDTVFPFFNNGALTRPQLKLPKLVKRPNRIDRIEVDVHGAGKFNLELLEDMGGVIEETYNARFGNLFFKTYIRVLLKYAAADITATQAGKQVRSDLATLTTLASAAAGKKAADASEGADIRMSRYLPNKAYVGGINLDPGTYHVTVHYYSGSSHVAKDEHENVAVRANGLNLIESINLR